MRSIHAAAPVRICDNGGWTDTWFAEWGRVFSIAVTPRVEVRVCVRDGGSGLYRVEVENYGERFEWRASAKTASRHPLIDAVMAAASLPADMDGEVAIRSEVPPGASTGTSAAVAVALVGALARVTGRTLTPCEIAVEAHDIETRRLGRESGVQDHFAAACGGINLLEIDRYPATRVVPLALARDVRAALERRLLLVYLGRSHESSAVHQTVISSVRSRGPHAGPLEALRHAAAASAAAVLAGDLDALGRAMQANTAAQVDLHPELVGRDARRVIDVAAAHGAPGWKVNGAGGAGGSVTILCGPAAGAREACARAVDVVDPLFRQIPIALDTHGVRVWDT